MNIVIIQECGRHDANREFRESLCLQRSLSKIDGINAVAWGLNYPNYNTPFSEMEKWADVIFVIENYTSGWLPMNELSNSKKMKIFWSIDSHYGGMLNVHQQLCRTIGVNILLNSTESFIKDFEGLADKKYWFPNSYPDDLIYPLNIEKVHNIGFCGNNRPEIHYLDKFGIKKDIFVIGDEMVKAINSYKIHFNKNISNDINYRTFETTGCRTLLMTNYTPGLEKLFDIGKEIITYENTHDLDDKINYYLNNESERIKIETAGYERSKKDHTYFERSKMLVDIINQY